MNSPDASFLVSTEWLEKHLADSALRIFDCTGSLGSDYANLGREKHYDVHHIPGAAYLDVANPKGEMSNPDAALPFTWPTEAQFEATMSRIGVDNQCRVILYSGPDPVAPESGIGTTWATRAWWLMHHFGVDCAILDGGWRKWVHENRPVSSVPHAYPPATFKAREGWNRGLAMKEDVLDAINVASACLIDSLSPESYRGEVDRNYGTFGSRKGHITGAVNVNFASLVDPLTGCFLPLELLRKRFENGGANTQGKVITYCGGGIGATMTGFSLKLIGHDNVAIYDASLMEWANDPSLPMTDPSREDAKK